MKPREAGSPLALAVLPLAGDTAVSNLLDAAASPSSGPDRALLTIASLAQVGPQTIANQRAVFDSLSPADQQYVLAHLRAALGAKLDPLLISLIDDAPVQTATLVTVVQELGTYPTAPLAMVPKLVEIAQEPLAAAELRNAAVRALGGYGTAAEEAIPMMSTLLEGADQSSHAAAAAALADDRSGQPQDSSHAFGHVGRLRRSKRKCSQSAGRVGPAGARCRATPGRSAAVPEPVSLAAATALGSIAPSTPAVTEALLPLTKANEQAARTAVAALGHMGPVAASLLIPLLVSSASEPVWQDASDALAGMGVAVAPPLLELLRDETLAPEIATRLIQTLGKMGSPVEPFVRQALGVDTLSSAARNRLVATLLAMGPRSLATLDWVKLKLSRCDRPGPLCARCSARMTLAKMEPSLRGVLPYPRRSVS